MGRATLSARGKPSVQIKESLFLPGDRSILPHTPHSIRAGKSPWKGGLSALGSAPHSSATPYLSGLPPPPQLYSYGDRENLVYAFSEASGWTPQMEDRVLVACPVPGRPAWTLFGVCDGHGGSFCSSFLSKQLPLLLAKEADMLADRAGPALGTSSDADTTPDLLRNLLLSTCAEADKRLQEHPRMAVEWTKSGNISCLDSSGSTAVMALVSPRYVAVANVGDSRCVLAQKAAEAGTGDRLLTPFRTHVPSAGGEGLGSFCEGKGSCLLSVGLSNDHKFNDPAEKSRAVAAGAM